MPSINDIKITKSKKFEKKVYRPWDDEIVTDVPNIDNIIVEPIGDSVSNVEDIDNTILVNKIIDLKKFERGLYGVQKSSLYFLIKNVINVDENFAYTKDLDNIEFCEAIKAPISSIKVAISRLKKQNILENYESKPGRGGYTSFKISLEIYDHFKSQN